jgi:hypothetical protein
VLSTTTPLLVSVIFSAGTRVQRYFYNDKVRRIGFLFGGKNVKVISRTMLFIKALLLMSVLAVGARAEFLVYTGKKYFFNSCSCGVNVETNSKNLS